MENDDVTVHPLNWGTLIHSVMENADKKNKRTENL